MTATAPRVFISYSHDSDEHRDRVLELADRLRADGIDAVIDQYVQSPPEGWPAWCEAEIRKSDFVPMICTETYIRRVNGEEEPGKGRGVLWEARLIKQHLYDARLVSNKFIPVLLADGSGAHVPTPVKGGTVYRVETLEGYDALLRLLTDQPLTPMPALGRRRSLPPKQRRAIASLAEPARPLAALPHPRVEDLFVGRSAEREQLAAALFPASGTRRPVVVSGMAGVGKSYLVDRFFWENGARFPSGYLRLASDPDKPATAVNLVSKLRDQLKLPVDDDGTLRARLLTPPTLVHLENVDTPEAGQVAGDLAASLSDCALVITARLRGLGADAGWREVAVSPFDAATALDQLRAELGDAAPDQERWPALAEAIGYLPLALHLAAGHLRRDHRAEAFLRRLRAKNLAMTGADPADPTFRQSSRALLSDTFELSLDALRREGGADGEDWLKGFSALGHAPATGFVESLGAAIANLTMGAFEDMALAAARLSLLDRVPRGARSSLCLHPLLAELVGSRADKDAALARTREWFAARLVKGGDDQGRHWDGVGAEFAGLTEGSPQVPHVDRARVAHAGIRYAIGEALKIRNEQLPVYARLGYLRQRAVTMGRIADVLQARGQLDEAFKILKEEVLPATERLGDARSRAVTMGKIADVLQARGQLDEALKIRDEEELAVYERLGDVRSRAVTMGKIADILQARGQLDEALKIRNEEQLPVYERLGDVRSRAVTMGKIADILQARGQLNEALNIRNEELAVYERVGDMRSLLVGRANLAITLLQRGHDGDRKEACRLLHLALDEAKRLKLPEPQQIEEILAQAEFGDEEHVSPPTSE
jgi:tetratricopeptide (TPR) repeat protein